MTKLTPAQEQYMTMKKQHPDCLLLFRMGDFYEMFYEDAQTAHKVLGITLTSRDKNAESPVPMAGIPYHALEKYLPKLIHAGCKVAIADQVGEVVPGKLVHRTITQVITPGTRVEEGKGSCYLLALAQNNDLRHIAWGDWSLGVRRTRSFATLDEALKFMLQLSPVEVLLAEQVSDKAYLERRVQDHLQAVISIVPLPTAPDARLMHTLGVSSLAGFGESLKSGRQEAVITLFSYLQSRSPAWSQQLYVRRLEYRQENHRVTLDALTIKNLELFQSSYQGNKKQSLLAVINSCVTPMGARLLAQRLQEPIHDAELLCDRHDKIEHRYQDRTSAQQLRSLLTPVGDIPRVLQKLSLGAGILPLLRQLRDWLIPLFHERQAAEVMRGVLPSEIFTQTAAYLDLLETMIQDELIDPQDRMRSWVDTHLDELRQRAQTSDELLLGYQQEITQKTGVSVKIKHIAFQGYYLEVTPKDIQRFEWFAEGTDEKRGFVRAQTLKTGQRYLSSYLQSVETQVKQAQEELLAYQALKAQELVQQLLAERSAREELSDAVAGLDLAISISLLAHEQQRTKPTMHTWFDLEIIGGRHPVVERFLPIQESFIPNDSHFTSADFFHLITGPNMGGKSTYMRQQALIVLLAHAGLRVPAKQATIWLVDGIYARIGSGDILVQQQSTFMTEMLETAAILHTATQRSLVIFDELGRGTSTYDGLAIAKAVCVYVCTQIKCKTLFATHYHELISLEEQLPGLSNRSVSVYETDKEVVFLKKIVRGGASKSYGLDVAKLAGLPSDVLGLAREYLQHLEQQQVPKPMQQELGLSSAVIKDERLVKLREKYAHLDINQLTPMQAMGLLEQIVEEMRREK